MTTDVAMIKGEPAMMYSGTPPWQGLGTELDHPATAAQAITAAHLDWEVVKIPVYCKHGRYYQGISNRFAMVREDCLMRGTTNVLGVVGSQYRPLQNVDAFRWFDAIVGAGKAVYHTAGALGDGQRVWILAKLPEPIRIAGDDTVQPFLLLSNSHDGSSSVSVKFAPIRFCCWNSLMMASATGAKIRIRHNGRLQEQLEIAKTNWASIHSEYAKMGEVFQRMAAISMSEPRLAEYLCAVFPTPKPSKNERALRYITKARRQARYLFDQGTGNRQPPTAGTLWAAYNGVTEFIDYAANNRGPDRHLDSIWFGDGYYHKVRAYRVALEKAQQWRN